MPQILTSTSVIGSQTLASPDHTTEHGALAQKIGYGIDYPTPSKMLVGDAISGNTSWSKTAPVGEIVGTTDSQVLTNKTLGTGTNLSLPGQSAGDMFYIDGTNTLTRLPIGANNDVLVVVGGLPTWQAGGGGGGVTNINGEAGVLTLTAGVGVNTGIKITTSPGNITVGIDNVSIPEFFTTKLTNLTAGPNVGVFTNINKELTTTGVLQYNQGGTGQSTFAQGDIIYASAPNTLSKLTIGAFNDVLTVGGGGVPVWQAGGGGGGVTSIASDANPARTGAITFTSTANRVSISNTLNDYTFSIPQDINTAATPTFAGLKLSGLSASLPVFTDGATPRNLVTISTIPQTVGGTGFTTYATGDILYASAPNVLSKLPAGTGGQVLTMAAGVPTWGASSGATGFPQRVYANKNGNQAIPYSTWTVITNWTEIYDTSNEFDPVTGIFTASATGTYIINYQHIFDMTVNTTGISYGMINLGGTTGQTSNNQLGTYPTHYNQLTWIVALTAGNQINFRGNVNLGTGLGVTMLASILSAGITLRTSIQIQRIY